LLTNNPIKRIGVSGYGLEIVQNSPLDWKKETP
jgi:GTP cyclohydrolase II